MTSNHLARTSLIFAAALACVASPLRAQAPPPAGQTAPPPGGAAVVARGGGAGRGGGLPGATTEQTQAVADMNTALAPLAAAVTAARNEVATATFADPRSDAAIAAAIDKLRVAELALATRRAEEFAKLQAGPNKLNAEQVAALVAAGGTLPAGRGGRGGGAGAPGGTPGGAPAPCASMESHPAHRADLG